MKKVELEQKLLEAQKEIEELKGVKTMETKTETKKEFNAYDYVKTLIVRAQLANKDIIQMYQANGNVLSWLQRVGAISGYTIEVGDETQVDENNRRYVKVTLKGVNLKAKAKSKAGKEFNVFPTQIIGREYARLLA